MCNTLKNLDGKKPNELIRDFKLDKSVPIDFSKVLSYYDIPIIESDFEDMNEFQNIRKKIESKGEILGAVVVDNNKIKIFYRKNDNRHRQKFTIAHEFAHCCLNAKELAQEGHIEFRTDMESPCDEHEEMANIFAGELLIPKTLIDNIYKKNEIIDLNLMSRIFDVSHNVMKARLDYLNRPYYFIKNS